MSAFVGAPRHSAEFVDEFVRKGYWNDDTLEMWLDRWSSSEPDRPAVRLPDRDISFGELHINARKVAHGLLDLGLTRGDTIAVQLPNIPEFIYTYLGVALMGGVLSPLHMPYRAGELAPMLNHGRARAIVCGPATDRYDAPGELKRVQADVPTLAHVISTEARPIAGCVPFGALLAGSDGPIANPPRPEDWVLLNFTSGTSASPKAVVRSYQTLLSNARIFAPYVALTGDDVVMSAPPFSHGFGICVTNMALYTGAVNLLLAQYTPEAYARTIERGRPTLIFSAPAHLAAALKEGHFAKHDFGSVRDIILGGSVCPPIVAEQAEALLPNGRIGQLFGMTETILSTQTRLDDDAHTRHTTAGRGLDEIELRVTDGDGNVLGPGEEGELQFRGYSVVAGYFGNDAANAECFDADGWFRSGDLARIDADGNVIITGRSKEIINRGSVKLNPTDVESLITEHPDVIMAAIVPMPDDILGERACLFVSTIDRKRLALSDITAFLAEHDVAKIKWPERLEVLDEMPMTPTRKIAKGELQKRVGELAFSRQGGDKA